MKENFFEEATAFFFKVILPAVMGVSVKVAVMLRRGKMTYTNIILSFIIGVGVACLCSSVIFKVCSPTYATMVLAIVSISGDKIAEYFIDKFNVDGFLTALFDNLIRKKDK